MGNETVSRRQLLTMAYISLLSPAIRVIPRLPVELAGKAAWLSPAAAVLAAAAIGWVEGYSDGTFRPDQYITRAETMTLVNRVLERAVRADGMLDGMIVWWDNHADAWYYADVQEATNSHSYIRTDAAVPGYGFNYEEPRVWEALEQVWSSANS